MTGTAGLAGQAGRAGPAGPRPVICPSCGREAGPQDNFCEGCRAELIPAVVSGDPPGAARACAFCPAAPVTADGYCESCGRKTAARQDRTELDLGALAGVTDRGLRHYRNEDAMALATAESALGPAAVAVVCDGVSTSQRPDEASLAAAQAAVRVLLAAVRTGQDLAGASRQAVSAAQDAVASLHTSGGAPGADPPSATFVSAVLGPADVVLCWLGDSRAYWLGDGSGPPSGARQLTTDDSLASEMVAAGLVSAAGALALPEAHVVTGWVGADSGTEPHIAAFEPPGPGVLLLCSDGLWNYQAEAGRLAGLALPRALADPLGAARALVQFALDAGGSDNVTAVLAPFPPAAARPPAGHPDPEENLTDEPA